MKKPTYIPPEITVVDFKVENGYVNSALGTAEAENMRFTRLFQNDEYATGESFTVLTDDDGEFATGRW